MIGLEVVRAAVGDAVDGSEVKLRKIANVNDSRAR